MEHVSSRKQMRCMEHVFSGKQMRYMECASAGKRMRRMDRVSSGKRVGCAKCTLSVKNNRKDAAVKEKQPQGISKIWNQF